MKGISTKACNHDKIEYSTKRRKILECTFLIIHVDTKDEDLVTSLFFSPSIIIPDAIEFAICIYVYIYICSDPC